MLKRLPRSDALVVYLDFAALRGAGILDMLDNPKIAQEPEYQDFVRKIDFDYKHDLDSAMIAFAPTGKFLLVRGQFDWKSLRSFVESESGRCYNSLCRMQGSTPQRRISFFPLQSKLMALAVSEDESAALRMQELASGPDPELPSAPVWMSVPPSVLESNDLPAGTRPFARSMERAESVLISFAPEGKRLAATLNVRCRTAQDAADLVSQLSRTTALLRQMIERENHKPNPGDLSGVLTSGAFRNDGVRVFGYWPIERSFIENLLGNGQS
ncbi:MAG: hypothetical protein C5B51_18130 [Terriglobia bacterium]|nr:MAG: hypothetical protein C5B51_18130 [Terriglobia bacterium]